MLTRKFLLAGLALLLVTQAGCIFSPEDDPDPVVPPPATLPFPGTPEQLMKNFETIYETMDIEGYRHLLHPDYLTILKESTTADFPEVGTTLDITEEFRIHERMFSGQSGTNADGSTSNPISSIEFDEPDQETNWETSPGDDPIPNAEAALFNVRFLFHRAGDTSLEVKGRIKFYITARDSLYQGVVKPYYQMIGQWDFTEDG